MENYSRAWELSSESYPAALAMARIMGVQGNTASALQLLSELELLFPENSQIRRERALVYYRAEDWARAESAIDEILELDNRDGEFVLMKAHIHIERSQFLQAQSFLDLYTSINSGSRFYAFLLARVQFEAYRNRDAALNLLRPHLRNLIDDEASAYTIQLLLESGREADQTEGRDLLYRLLDNTNPSLTILNVALEDSIQRQAWRESRVFMNRLLAERRSSRDLFNAYTIEKEQGNHNAAFSYARELYERDTSAEEGIMAYISALINIGRRDEAVRIIDINLENASAGAMKSRFYYLRSVTHTGEDAALEDLRSSLFEDPRNLNALIALFEFYHQRNDERWAVYYLRQALVLDPDNPRLKYYETEYAPL